MQQQMILDKAYDAVPIQTKASVVSKIKEPDFIDQGYVYLRTLMPSWMIAAIFLFGCFTIVMIKFKKPIRRFLLGVLEEK